MKITLYHNAACSKSLETLSIIRAAGIEPTIIEFLIHPLSQNELQELATLLQCSISSLMRENDVLYSELNLAEENCTEQKRLDALLLYPQLFNRPIAVSEFGARICRPPELVLEILPV